MIYESNVGNGSRPNNFISNLPNNYFTNKIFKNGTNSNLRKLIESFIKFKNLRSPFNEKIEN